MALSKEEKEFQELLKSLLEPIGSSLQKYEGKSLKDLFDGRMAELSLSQNQVENLINIEKKSLNGILDKTAKRVDVVNILKLAQFLNLPVDEFLNIYLSEMPVESIGELEKARKSNFIATNFDLVNLRKSKFIDSKSDFGSIESRINSFFGFDNIFQFESDKHFPAFSRTKKTSNNQMRDFWVKSAYAHFKGLENPNEYDRSTLTDLMPKIRPYTMNVENGLLTVARALYNVGVTVIYQPHLPTVQVRGATFVIDNKPCIVITDLGKRYPTLWFALLHELHHVLYDFEEIQTRTYHLTGEPDLFLMQEDQADDFAGEYLFSRERSKYIEPFIDDALMVSKYAKECHIHPSIIYNAYSYSLAKKGYGGIWGKYKDFFPDVSAAVQAFNTNPWQKETIQESINQLKQEVFNLK